MSCWDTRVYHQTPTKSKPNPKQLFISLRNDKRCVTKNTISAWVIKLLRTAHNLAGEDECTLYKTSVHEVRALAASLALQATYSLDSILQAATWASHTTFTSHYLRDVSGLQGQLHTIGPCIVAGAVLH